MERTGYVPGELLPVVIEIQNNSSRVVVPKVAICQKQTFLARSGIKEERETLNKLKGKPLNEKSAEKLHYQLNVPQCPPSILNCPILLLEYVLMVQLKIPRATNLSLDMPLVIGSIPVAYPSDFLMQPISVISK
ncbi:arrestin domain-containing protein 3-like [Protopterus annectens]|uniref:arrestin domain-containing protein 3-like n=1 Tax=Protopterus annectens TaxID=7888 RepID=UPI001CFA29F1|nr:arrestin domain-containing protein 3-like [Protopterus annectens]XP_043920077.1 arrestin domain-containing protein 3-like [Protopterus annectens]